MSGSGKIRATLAAAIVAVGLVVVGASAAVKPALTLGRGGTVTTTGSLTIPDSGHNWTPSQCRPTTPNTGAPVPNEGQCDLIPVQLAVPKGLPADFKIGISATVTFPQTTAAGGINAIQVCEFPESNENVYSCGGGSGKFDDPAVAAPLAVTTAEKLINVVVDQRIGYNTSYKLTVSWVDLSHITTLTVKAARAGGKSTLTATLLDDKKKPIKGQTVQFLAGTKPLGNAVTDAQGHAALKGVAPGQAVKAFFAGNDTLTSSSATTKS